MDRPGAFLVLWLFFALLISRNSLISAFGGLFVIRFAQLLSSFLLKSMVSSHLADHLLHLALRLFLKPCHRDFPFDCSLRWDVRRLQHVAQVEVPAQTGTFATGHASINR